VKKYFAYGSNMDEGQIHRSVRCPNAIADGKAVLHGHRFIINERGVATVIPHPGCGVRGSIWLLDAEDEARLDRREGVSLGCYQKELVQVEGDGGSLVDAIIYIDPIQQTGVPRPGYLERIVAAARQLQFPSEYVDELAKWGEPPRDQG
jgi:cation transport regulator ChaC